MFTIEQIKAAHSKVKSGADFPNYVQELIQLGVVYYETFVSDGHTEYSGNNDFKISSDEKYKPFEIAETSNILPFQKELKDHQQGKTDYLTFCEMCAKYGVYKWVVCMEKITCAYYDKAENEMLVEIIPNPSK